MARLPRLRLAALPGGAERRPGLALPGRLHRLWKGAPVILFGLARAYVRALTCRLVGHRPDPSIPSPPGKVFCGRCRTRFIP